MIEFNDISVVFEKDSILKNVVFEKINLKIAPRDFITVVGSNGAGKSTLLRLLAGILFPHQGEILLNHLNITYQSVQSRSKWIGYVCQDPRLGTFETLTVEENLAFAFRRGKKRSLNFAINKELRKKFRTVLAELETGLEHRLTERVMVLSGGQRQLLSLVMAILQPPKILLLDEHTAALDPNAAKNVLELTKKIVSAYQLTALMVTHNMSDALEIGNRTILMQHGKIIREFTENEKKLLTPTELMYYL